MKSLEKFCKENNLILATVNYRFSGMLLSRKGYDICHPTGHIVVSFEPVTFNYYKDKWMIRNMYVGYDGPDYLVKITRKFLKSLKLDAETYIVNTSVRNQYLIKNG